LTLEFWVSKSQVRHIAHISESSLQPCQEEVQDDMEALYTFLERSQASYVSLIQKVKQTDNCTRRKNLLYNKSKVPSGPLIVEEMDLFDHNNSMATTVINKHWQERNTGNHQEMMVGVAYTTPHELKQFQLFHQVLHADATADSNKEGHPLFTITGKNSLVECSRQFAPSCLLSKPGPFIRCSK